MTADVIQFPAPRRHRLDNPFVRPASDATCQMYGTHVAPDHHDRDACPAERPAATVSPFPGTMPENYSPAEVARGVLAAMAAAGVILCTILTLYMIGAIQ